MAKRKKNQAISAPGLIEWRPPTPAQRLRRAADDLATTAIEAHATTKKKHDAIVKAVEGATRHILGPGRTTGGKMTGY